MIVNKEDYDHPDHFSDKIEEYISEQRYIPKPLLDLLLEQAGHKCTICNSNSYDLHHIVFLENGGKTEYENLIAVCPNCHRRIHKENIPNPEQLRHYKLKLEISYSLPIIGQLTNLEKQFLLNVSEFQSTEELLIFNQRIYDFIDAPNQEEAKRILRKRVGLFNLELNEIISLDYGMIVTDEVKNNTLVNLHLSLKPKGVKWINYLKETGRIELLKTK